MSTYGIHVPAPDEHDYHADRQQRRMQRALKSLDPGDVLAIIDSRIASEPDPTQHPLYHLVCWHLEKCLTPMDGGVFFDRCRQLVIDATTPPLMTSWRGRTRPCPAPGNPARPPRRRVSPKSRGAIMPPRWPWRRRWASPCRRESAKFRGASLQTTRWLANSCRVWASRVTVV